jgi:HK97 family phage portal protein
MKTLNEEYAERGLDGRPIFGQFDYYKQYGLVDQTLPNESRLRRDFRGIFFRCIEMRSDAVADALTKSYVEREIGQNEFEVTEYTHPWYKLLKNPSLIWSARDVWRWAVQEYDLSGRADFIVERGANGMPLQLLPVYREFGYIEAAPSSQGGISHWLLYRSDGKIIPILRENVLRLDRKAPWSPYESISLIEAARFELETQDSMKRYRSGSVKNGGFSSPVLTTDQNLNDTQHKQLTKEYKQFIGVQGTEGGKVAVLGSGTKPWSPMNARDLEYIEGEIQTDKTLMIITGVPPGLFETVTTRATADAAQVVFSQVTISPLLSLFTEQITHQFEIIFNAEKNVLYVRPPEVTPLDKDFDLRQREVYLRTGQRTINDYLKEDGFEEDPAANERYIQLGLTPLRADQTQPERSLSQRTPEQRAALWRSIDKKKQRQAKLIEPTLKEWFNSVQRKIIKRLEEYEPKRSFTQDVFNPLDEEFDLLSRIAPDVIRALRAGFANGLELSKVTGLEFTLNSPYTQNTLKTILEKQSSIPQTLFNEVSEKIRQGMQNNVSRAEMVNIVGEFFDGYAPGKIENIANGLSTSAWESGQDVAYNEAGIEGKEWLSSRDGRVRPTHDEADGTRVGLNEFFSVGGSELKHPGDPNGEPEEVIGCRCITLPVT